MFAWAWYSCAPRALHTLMTYSTLTEISTPVTAFSSSVLSKRGYRALIGKCRGEAERAGLASDSQTANGAV